MISTPYIERFWARVEKTDFCWNWTAGRNRGGYGILWLFKQTRLAHRISYEIHKGVIPDGLFVLHHCDNPACVNPKHLYTGTYQDNWDDRQGRYAPY